LRATLRAFVALPGFETLRVVDLAAARDCFRAVVFFADFLAIDDLPAVMGDAGCQERVGITWQG
jgi:hypothetical protein